MNKLYTITVKMFVPKSKTLCGTTKCPQYDNIFPVCKCKLREDTQYCNLDRLHTNKKGQYLRTEFCRNCRNTNNLEYMNKLLKSGII